MYTVGGGVWRICEKTRRGEQVEFSPDVGGTGRALTNCKRKERVSTQFQSCPGESRTTLEDRGNSQIPLHCDIIFLRVRENRTRSQGEDVQENHSGCRRQRIRRLSTKYSQLHLRGIMRVPASGQVIEIDGRIRCSTEDTCGQFTCSQFESTREP